MVAPQLTKRAEWTVKLEMGITALFITILLIWAGYLYTHMNAYCLFAPAIDTQFARDFSEEKFEQVQPGMSQAELKRLLGEPLDKGVDHTGAIVWWYSRGGKCDWGDFAWLGRAVRIKSGAVIEVVKRVQYN